LLPHVYHIHGLLYTFVLHVHTFVRSHFPLVPHLDLVCVAPRSCYRFATHTSHHVSAPRVLHSPHVYLHHYLVPFVRSTRYSGHLLTRLPRSRSTTVHTVRFPAHLLFHVSQVPLPHTTTPSRSQQVHTTTTAPTAHTTRSGYYTTDFHTTYRFARSATHHHVYHTVSSFLVPGFLRITCTGLHHCRLPHSTTCTVYVCYCDPHSRRWLFGLSLRTFVYAFCLPHGSPLFYLTTVTHCTHVHVHTTSRVLRYRFTFHTTHHHYVYVPLRTDAFTTHTTHTTAFLHLCHHTPPRSRLPHHLSHTLRFYPFYGCVTRCTVIPRSPPRFVRPHHTTHRVHGSRRSCVAVRSALHTAFTAHTHRAPSYCCAPGLHYTGSTCHTHTASALWFSLPLVRTHVARLPHHTCTGYTHRTLVRLLVLPRLRLPTTPPPHLFWFTGSYLSMHFHSCHVYYLCCHTHLDLDLHFYTWTAHTAHHTPRFCTSFTRFHTPSPATHTSLPSAHRIYTTTFLQFLHLLVLGCLTLFSFGFYVWVAFLSHRSLHTGSRSRSFVAHHYTARLHFGSLHWVSLPLSATCLPPGFCTFLACPMPHTSPATAGFCNSLPASPASPCLPAASALVLPFCRHCCMCLCRHHMPCLTALPSLPAPLTSCLPALGSPPLSPPSCACLLLHSHFLPPLDLPAFPHCRFCCLLPLVLSPSLFLPHSFTSASYPTCCLATPHFRFSLDSPCLSGFTLYCL